MKKIIICLSFFFTLYISSQTPPAPGAPNGPGGPGIPGLPINELEKILLTAGIFLGIYIIKKRQKFRFK